jgi:hypothetical protein
MPYKTKTLEEVDYGPSFPMPFSYAIEIQGDIPRSDIIIGLNNIENESKANVMMMISESRKKHYDEIQEDMNGIVGPLGLNDLQLRNLSPEELLARRHFFWNKGLNWAINKMEHEQLHPENTDERTLLLRQYLMGHLPVMTNEETLVVGKEDFRKATDILQARGNILELVDKKHRYKFREMEECLAEVVHYEPEKQEDFSHTDVVGRPLDEKELRFPDRHGKLIY